MQYEIIILELMTRIKQLENEVASLKEHILNQNSDNADTGKEDERSEYPVKSSGIYRKTTDEMIMMCYKCGKKFQEGENPMELADLIESETGMNRNSAIMYLYAVKGLLSGTIFKRAISAKALKKYYDMIFNEYGSAALRRALDATRLHIEYRAECGGTTDSLEELCAQYRKRL